MLEWQWYHPTKTRVLKNELTLDPRLKEGVDAATRLMKKKEHRGVDCKKQLITLASLLSTAMWRQCDLCVNFVDEQNKRFFDIVSGILASHQQHHHHHHHHHHHIRTAIVTQEDIDIMHKEQRPKRPVVSSCCSLCSEAFELSSLRVWSCPSCHRASHTSCLARSIDDPDNSSLATMIPSNYQCIGCYRYSCKWIDIIKASTLNLEGASADHGGDGGGGDDDDDDTEHGSLASIDGDIEEDDTNMDEDVDLDAAGDDNDYIEVLSD